MVAILVNMLLSGERTLAYVFLAVTLVTLFRELAITSLRLVVAGSGKKVNLAANIFGKLKTVSQMVGTVVIILEPLFGEFGKTHILSYVFMALMAVTTLVSGYNYFVAYIPLMLDNEKEEK